MQRDEAINVDAKAPVLIHIDRGALKSIQHLLIVLWLSAFCSAAATVAFIFMMETLRVNNGKLAVLEYDHQTLRAELEARGVIPTKNELGH